MYPLAMLLVQFLDIKNVEVQQLQQPQKVSFKKMKC
jgi:hypothetical protein